MDTFNKQVVELLGGVSNIDFFEVLLNEFTFVVFDTKKLASLKEFARLQHIHRIKPTTTGVILTVDPHTTKALDRFINTKLKESQEQTELLDTTQKQEKIPSNIRVTSLALDTHAFQSNSRDNAPQNSNLSDTEILHTLLKQDTFGDYKNPSPKLSSRDIKQVLSNKKLLVINGPSLTLLGLREPHIYGTDTYYHLVNQTCEYSKTRGFNSCECFQSNHEGELVDVIIDAYNKFDGIIINPCAYTHTSVAILDALLAVQIPYVEVHISDIDNRESFRQISYIRHYALSCICGEGIQGYLHAIDLLANHLYEQEPLS